MFHIIKQYKQVLFSLIMANFTSEQQGIDAVINSDTMKSVSEKSKLGSLESRIYRDYLNSKKDFILNFDSKDKATVKDLQKTLNRLGFRKDNGAELFQDGILGKNTEEVLKNARTLIVEYNSIIKSSQDARREGKEISSNVFTRNLSTGLKGGDVQALQQFLKKKGYYTDKNDSRFGPNTEKALKAYQTELQKSNPNIVVDGKLTVTGNITEDRTIYHIRELNTINDQDSSFNDIMARRSNEADAITALKKGKTRVDALTKLNENNEAFYKLFEAWRDRGFNGDIFSDSGSFSGWALETLGMNKPSEYATNLAEEIFENKELLERVKEVYKNIENEETDKEKNKEADKEKVKKFNEEFQRLVDLGVEEGFDTDIDKTLGSYAVRDIMILVVLNDIPLIDLRFNFIKRLKATGIPMDRALEFTNWVLGGMDGTPNYESKHLKSISGVDALKNIGNVRVTLASYGLSGEEITHFMKGEIELFSDDLNKLLYVILEDRIIPDLIGIKDGGFNWLEKLFDDKDNKLGQIIKKLMGNEHIVGEGVTLKKMGDKYILRKGTWNKVYDEYPTEDIRKGAISTFEGGDKAGWIISTSSIIPFGTLSYGDHGIKKGRNEKYTILKTGNSEYYVENRWGEYKKFNSKPNFKTINESHYGKESDWDNRSNGKFDKGIPVDEVFRDLGEATSIIDEQVKEGRWIGGTDELKYARNNMVDRIRYTSDIERNIDFIQNVFTIDLKDDKELSKRFSALSMFDHAKDFVKAFPTTEEVKEYLLRLDEVGTNKQYILMLEDATTEVKEYMDIIANSGTTEGLIAWKKYCKDNIKRFDNSDGKLKLINQGADRENKYGNDLRKYLIKNYNEEGEDLGYRYDILKGEDRGRFYSKLRQDLVSQLTDYTTDPSTDPKKPVLDVAGELINNQIGKQGITDVTSEDLVEGFRSNIEIVSIIDLKDELKDNLINTSRGEETSSDMITSFDKLFEKRGDLHVFKTQITKTVSVYRRDGVKIDVTKVFDVYVRPECMNLLIVPNSTNVTTLEQADFNPNVSTLMTATGPLTLNTLNAIKDMIDKPNNGGGGTGSKPGDTDNLPTSGSTPDGSTGEF